MATGLRYVRKPECSVFIGIGFAVEKILLLELQRLIWKKRYYLFRVYTYFLSLLQHFASVKGANIVVRLYAYNMVTPVAVSEPVKVPLS